MTDRNTTIAQVDFDRLVDGELNETERRELIAKIDSTAAGWRRCALSFLEAQELRRLLTPPATTTSQSSGNESVSLSTVISSRSTRPDRRYWPVLVAGLLLAFLTGLQTGRVSSPMAQDRPKNIHITGTNQKPVKQDNPVEQNADNSKQPAPEHALNAGSAERVALPNGNLDEIRIVGLVRVADDQSTPSNYSMPVFAGPGLNQEWLNKQPLPYSAEDVHRLKQEGYDVQQRRQLMHVDLVNGSSLAIPFGTVHLQYVGNEIH